MKNKFLSLFLLATVSGLFFFISCKKNIADSDAIPDPSHAGFAIPPATPVTGSVSGMILDENNNPVPSAEVNCAGSTYITDTRGSFDINNVQLDKYVSTVTVKKAGYFKAFRSFCANATRNFLFIKLLPKTLTGTISGSPGGSVTLPNGAAIHFQANSIIVKSSGIAYTGTVNVYAAYIDPASSDFSDIVPGSMMGHDSSNMYVLRSTGMIAVDIESATGETLQLSPGKTASVDLPIPASLVSKAPPTIDTWSLDEHGTWKKEGIATRNGNMYEMQVTHFSFWNCDLMSEPVYLTIHVQDQHNQPLPNRLVELIIASGISWGTSYGMTDSLGNASGMVPANEALIMKVILPCNAPAYTQNIGPFATNAAISVNLTIDPSQVLTVSGTANDCNNHPIQNGTAAIYFPGQYGTHYTSITNGNYSTDLFYCASTQVIVSITDNNTKMHAQSASLPITGNSVSVPFLKTCDMQPAAAMVINSCTPSGSFYVSIPIPPTDMLTTTATVSATGSYFITTDTINGVSFSAIGAFTSIGNKTIQLRGTGTPLAQGNFVYTIHSSNGQGSAVSVTFNYFGNPQSPAVFSLGGPGNCPGTVVSGGYNVGLALGATNTVSFPVNVTSIGTYQITTGNSVNGLQFSATGTFLATGTQTVVLLGTGIPVAAGSFDFQVQTATSQGCTFNISTTVQNAVFSFDGNPGNCLLPVISGSYFVNSTLTSINYVKVKVDVTTLGNYAITTNQANGISFSAIGIFTTLGSQWVKLQGTGTPAQGGSYSYQAAAPGITGCTFDITAAVSQYAVFSTLPGYPTSGPFYCSGGPFGYYTVNVPINGSNYLVLSVNVTAPGAYRIYSEAYSGPGGNNCNIYFTKTGTLTTLGPQTITIPGNGNPIMDGCFDYNVIFDYQPPGTPLHGCSFSICVNY